MAPGINPSKRYSSALASTNRTPAPCKDLAVSISISLFLNSSNLISKTFQEKSKKYRLSNLIDEISKYSEIERIRFITSHPRDMTDDLIATYSNKKLMPLLHLPIQSGSNLSLIHI